MLYIKPELDGAPKPKGGWCTKTVPKAEAVYTQDLAIQVYVPTKGRTFCLTNNRNCTKKQQQKLAEHNKNHVYLCHILTRNAKMTVKH